MKDFPWSNIGLLAVIFVVFIAVTKHNKEKHSKKWDSIEDSIALDEEMAKRFEELSMENQRNKPQSHIMEVSPELLNGLEGVRVLMRTTKQKMSTYALDSMYAMKFIYGEDILGAHISYKKTKTIGHHLFYRKDDCRNNLCVEEYSYHVIDEDRPASNEVIVVTYYPRTKKFVIKGESNPFEINNSINDIVTLFNTRLREIR